MNRSFRAPDSQMQASVQRRQQGRNQLGSVMKEKEEELALFLEMRKREKERNNQLLIHNSEEFDAPLVSKPGSSPIFKIVPSAPARKTTTDDFLNSDNDKNDYDWLMTPPGTPLFPSLEMESQKTVMSQIGTPTGRPAAPKSRLANPQAELASRNNLVSRQPTLSPGLNSSSVGIRRPSSSGGPGSTASRPATPTGRPTLPAISKQPSRPSRPSTPTSRATLPSSKPTAPPARSSTPSARSSTPSARSSTPSARSSTPSARPSTTSTRPSTTSARSSTPTTRPTVPASKSTSRSATPTRRPSTPSSVSAPTRSSSVIKSGPTTTRNPISSCGSSPTIKSRPWKPSEMPGFSLDAPPNLRTSMPARPVSASRGRPGAPIARSSSEIGSNGRPRRQSCSPSRGRAPNGSVVHSSRSSVPASSRAYSNGNDNVSPVLMGTQMVERVVNMRKLAPPKQDDQRSTHNNSTGKSSSSLDSSGFGRTLSKKSLDMAMRHMDIRRSVPGSLRPLMTNIPASSMYSVRSGPTRSRPVSVSDSPLATSSNASSEQSINNNTLCLDACEVEDDDLGSERGGRSSPVSQCGR
ncbi:hypothetical protein BVC80_479g91 [Macleaya cordata]|uniref:ATP binding protein n=1 Tax=Macleaya cordata TaxID=56857 RepID=A0A200Q7S7_MACCD|nr:hypothetical protein BVC80_479g91 [Macleaya cordata]